MAATTPPPDPNALCGLEGEYRICAYAEPKGITFSEAGAEPGLGCFGNGDIWNNVADIQVYAPGCTTDGRGFDTFTIPLSPGVWNLQFTAVAIGDPLLSQDTVSANVTIPGGYRGSTGYPVAVDTTPHPVGLIEAGADGGVYNFGTARFHGSLGNIRLNKPVVGVAAPSTGGGYWLVASDGGIFQFGDAHLYGSLGNVHLNAPIVGMAATTDGHGYWLEGADGGAFNLGDAPFYGSGIWYTAEPQLVPDYPYFGHNVFLPGISVPFAGITALASGGYAMAFRTGIGYAAFNHSSLRSKASALHDAEAFGAMEGSPNAPVVGIATTTG